MTERRDGFMTDFETKVVLTANRLDDGVVIWMTADYRWTRDRAEAAEFTGDLRAMAMAQADADLAADQITALYEVKIDGIQNLSAREMIRAAGGPSVTPPIDRQHDHHGGD